MIKLINKALLVVGAGISGYLVGIISCKKRTKYAGVLRIDNSEKDISERLFLELDGNLNDIEKAKVIKLKVIRRNWI
jgi:hypothetical protein